MNAFTIKDLQNLSGIKAHTIRIWEQRYGIIKPQRTQTNIRYYSNDELKKILNIALLNRYGYKISHINKMGDAEIRDKIISLSNLHAQQERVVNDLIQHMVDMKIDRFEETLDTFISQRTSATTASSTIWKSPASRPPASSPTRAAICRISGPISSRAYSPDR